MGGGGGGGGHGPVQELAAQLVGAVPPAVSEHLAASCLQRARCLQSLTGR